MHRDLSNIELALFPDIKVQHLAITDFSHLDALTMSTIPPAIGGFVSRTDWTRPNRATNIIGGDPLDDAGVGGQICV